MSFYRSYCPVKLQKFSWCLVKVTIWSIQTFLVWKNILSPYFLRNGNSYTSNCFLNPEHFSVVLQAGNQSSEEWVVDSYACFKIRWHPTNIRIPIIKIIQSHHRNGKVVRVTALIFTGDVEACLQRLQWISGLSSWRPFGFSDWHKNIKRHTAHAIVSWPNPKQWQMGHTSDLTILSL